MTRRTFLKYSAAVAVGAEVLTGPGCSLLQQLTEHEQEFKVFLLGHVHTYPLIIKDIEDVLYDKDGDRQYKYLPTIERLLSDYKKQIERYKNDLDVIKPILLENRIVAVGLEYAQHQLEKILRGAKRDFETLVRLMEERKVPDFRKKAEEGYLLLRGPTPYLLAVEPLLFRGVVFFALVKEETVKRISMAIYRYLEIRKALTEICKKEKISPEVFKQWENFIVEIIIFQYRVPTEDEIAKVILPFEHKEAMKKAKKGIDLQVEIIKILKKTEKDMAEAILRAGKLTEGNVLAVTGYMHTVPLEHLLRERGLKEVISIIHSGGISPRKEGDESSLLKNRIINE